MPPDNGFTKTPRMASTRPSSARHVLTFVYKTAADGRSVLYTEPRLLMSTTGLLLYRGYWAKCRSIGLIAAFRTKTSIKK